MQPSSRSIGFTPAEREALERKQRRLQAEIDRIAEADSLEEQQRRGARAWADQVERPRAARRIEAARTVTLRTMSCARPRARGAGRPKVRGSSNRSSARSGDSGDDGTGSSDPFDQPVNQLLRGLRDLAREYDLDGPVYQLIPGSGAEPDRWRAKCPVHPSAGGYHILITELEDGSADVRCGVGCDAESIWRILVPDPEREALAEAYSRVLLWAQNYRRAA